MGYSPTFARRTEAYQDATEAGYDRSSIEVDELSEGFAWKPIIDPDDEEPIEPEGQLTLCLDGKPYSQAGITWSYKIALMLQEQKVGARILSIDAEGVISISRIAEETRVEAADG